MLKSFGFSDLTGQNPYAALIEGSDGALYGTTYNGGTGNGGTIFKVAKDGSNVRVLHHFVFTSSDGQIPQAGLLLGTNGWLYGTTFEGGSRTYGTIFYLLQDGSGYVVAHQFGVLDDGRFPSAGLMQASDGALYGTTNEGGTNNAGTIFKLNQNGSNYSVVYNFKSTGNDGSHPVSGLMEASDGSLYGVTSGGGSNNVGVVFSLNKDGTSYRILHHFSISGADGRYPQSVLIEGADAALYGTAVSGGSNNLGTVFKLNKDATGYTNLHHFTGGSSDGATPLAGLLSGSDGAFYGTTSQGGSNDVGTVFRLNIDGSAYAVLWQFSTALGEGRDPQAGLLEGSDGTLYGTTYNGGSSGVGTVFKLEKNGSLYRIIVEFSRSAGDAAGPQGGVILGTNGTLYGTTRNGGTYGFGAIYNLNRDGSGYLVLHSFLGTNGDGNSSWGPLLLAGDGWLYGTTHSGGSNGVGTIFKLKHDGTGYSVLYHFTGTNGDGANPASGLSEGADGALYGTTYVGGITGNGTVFKCSKDLINYQVLHGFTNTDGSGPEAKVIEGTDGALYGTTYYGGSSRLGTIFKLNADGTGYVTLHAFTAGQVDGVNPAAELLEASDGFLYGTTSSGGTNGSGAGTVFRLNKDGNAYTLLHSFAASDGGGLQAGLVEGSDGALYGTAYGGGSAGLGTIFTLNKDGTGFSVLRNFSGPDGRSLAARLAKQSNDVFYGTAFLGGAVNSGVVFQLLPPQTPDITSVVMVANSVQVIFSGAAGYHYSLLRSPDLNNWTVLSNITMPSNGFFTNVDAAVLPVAGFYRAAWNP